MCFVVSIILMVKGSVLSIGEEDVHFFVGIKLIVKVTV